MKPHRTTRPDITVSGPCGRPDRLRKPRFSAVYSTTSKSPSAGDENRLIPRATVPSTRSAGGRCRGTITIHVVHEREITMKPDVSEGKLLSSYLIFLAGSPVRDSDSPKKRPSLSVLRGDDDLSYDAAMDFPSNTPRCLVDLDPWLEPYREDIRQRRQRTEDLKARLEEKGGGLYSFADAHLYFGLHRAGGRWVFRELAPHACRIVLVGEFSAWKVEERFELQAIGGGVWEIELPGELLSHGMLYKLIVSWREGDAIISGERLPVYTRRVVQDPQTLIFSAQVWEPPQPYRWSHPGVTVSPQAPLIYEAHVGMAGEEPRLHTYPEFSAQVLPRIKAAGYNTIQLMAIQEHPYYGSFGYQVSNFFAPSSRFGTPEELKALVDTAHGMGLAVIMDLVHSHAVKNEIEGIGRIDGSYTLYCHGGARAEHPAWNTRLFDYAKDETLRFLLSNCRYWLEEFRFDGFRFDGVTSM
ncbi:MAG: 1,4-alpha-glucan-branching enzyme, partial [Pseudomonadota bacterium]